MSASLENENHNEHHHHEHRTLYDEDFLNANCPPDDFDPTTVHDTTVGTYMTNYIVAGIGMLAIFGIWLTFFRQIDKENLQLHLNVQQGQQKGQSSSYQKDETTAAKERKQGNIAMRFYENAKRRMVWRMVYFLLTSIAYLVAGIGHQFIFSKDDIAPYELISHITITLAVLSLQYDATLVYTSSSPYSMGTSTTKTRFTLCGFDVARHTNLFCGMYTRTIQIVLIMIALLFLIISKVIDMQFLVGFYKGASLLLLGVYFILFEQQQSATWLFGFGSFMSIMGLFAQLILSPYCGDEGYEDCFEECPLDNPTTFNHNALFHAMVAVGMLAQLIQTWVWANRLTARMSEILLHYGQGSSSSSSTNNQNDSAHDDDEEEIVTSFHDDDGDANNKNDDTDGTSHLKNCPDILSLTVSLLLLLSPLTFLFLLF